MNTVVKRIQQFGKEVGHSLTHFGNRIDVMNKGGKVLISGLEIAESIIKCIPVGSGAITGLALLRGKFKVLKAVVSGTNIFVYAKKSCNKEDRDGIRKTWQGIASHVNLTVGYLLEFVGFLHASEVVNLGRVATYSIGNVPVFHLVKSTFYGLGAIFGLAKEGPEADLSRKKMNQFTKKLNKWKQRVRDLKGHDPKVKEETADKIRKKMGDQHEIRTTKEWAKYQVKHLKFELAKETRTFTKKFISVAFNAGKIATLIIGIAVLALCPASLVVSIGVSSLGLVVNSFGFIKVMYANYTERNELTAPQFN